MRRRYPDEILVFVFNEDVGRKLQNVPKYKIEGKFAEMMFGKHYFDLFASADNRLQEVLRQIQQDLRALLISCPSLALVSTRTCDPVRLYKAYEAGIAAGFHHQTLRVLTPASCGGSFLGESGSATFTISLFDPKEMRMALFYSGDEMKP